MLTASLPPKKWRMMLFMYFVLCEKGESNLDLTVKAENFSFKLENSFETKGQIIQPKLEEFFKAKFGKAFDKLDKDLSKSTKAASLLIKAIRVVRNPEKGEQVAIDFLQHYGFIGKNINSFEELGESIEKFFKKNFKGLLSEEHVFHFYDTVELGRFIYYTIMYKSMLKSNKILVNALSDVEDYQDRLHVLSLLQDSDLLKAGQSETYFQCLNCKPGTAMGSVLMDIRVKNLSNFSCPICNQPFFYLAPLQLHPVLFDCITHSDGMLLFAALDLMEEFGLSPEPNVIIGGDVEIDIVATTTDGKKLFVECKMFGHTTSEQNLQRKISGAVKEIEKQLVRCKELDTYPDQYSLLVNVPDDKVLKAIASKLKERLKAVNVKLHTIDTFKSSLC